MDQARGYRRLDDIGGPMNIDEEYRWNVPILTYSFDQSFVDYFGSKGVAEVEAAFRIMNDVPPASRLVLSNFSLQAVGLNVVGLEHSLLDLKSATLSLVVEQLGLAQPVRNVFGMRRWFPALFETTDGEWDEWIPDYIIERNFDPISLGPTHYVNTVHYTGEVIAPSPAGPGWIVVFPLDIIDEGPAVADQIFSRTSNFPGPIGCFFRGLTRDDVGGLRYLLGRTNINFETLLPDVYRVGPGGHGHQSPVVNGAWRPGIEKLRFVRQQYNSVSGQAMPLTYRFNDTYFTNGTVSRQQLERIVTRPDFLFRAADVDDGDSALYVRTTTSHWRNNAAFNGDPTRAGPGVIQPPITITFHKLGGTVRTSDDSVFTGLASIGPTRWGSFEGSSNRPTEFPPATAPAADHVTLHFRLRSSSTDQLLGTHDWRFHLPIGERAALQVSSNIVNWTTVATPTNYGGVITWEHVQTSLPKCFFRVVLFRGTNSGTATNAIPSPQMEDLHRKSSYGIRAQFER
jgi:hypothetical protein